MAGCQARPALPSAPASTASVSRATSGATSDGAGASDAVVSAASTPTSAASAGCRTSGKRATSLGCTTSDGAGASGTAAPSPGPSLCASGVTLASGLPASGPPARSGPNPSLGKASAPPSPRMMTGFKTTAMGPVDLPAEIVIVCGALATSIPPSVARTLRVSDPAAAAGSKSVALSVPAFASDQGNWLVNLADPWLTSITTASVATGVGLVAPLSRVTLTSRAVLSSLEQATK